MEDTGVERTAGGDASAADALEGTTGFDTKVVKGLTSLGFTVHAEHTYGRGTRGKSDYLAVRDGTVLVVETKSPRECRNSWPSDQRHDSPRLRSARVLGRTRFAEGLSRKVAQHHAVIAGQIPDYADKMRREAIGHLPKGIASDAPMEVAYAVPESEGANVEAALQDLSLPYGKLNAGNGVSTYVYGVPQGRAQDT